ncbi:MAG: PIG-L family deacetylase [Oscillospiraceae bacterium]|nr:PIG-L family deacetylase [Oscillospiraceae bacterium]
MSLAKQIIRAAAPSPDLETFERFLFLGPHPDDIEIGAGATAAKLSASGKTVRFFICTDGRYGFDHAPAEIHTPEEMAAIRKEEAIRSAGLLGITDVAFGGFSDGAFYRKKELFHAILAAISDFRPDVVFCPDPCVTSECNSDHLNVGELTKRAVCFAPNGRIMQQHGLSEAPVKAIAFYMTAKPNRYVSTAGYFQKQLNAIFQCHKSQFPEGSQAAKSIQLYLKIRAYDFGIKTLHMTAEGFRVLGQTQMHCLPEAGD